MKKVILLLLFYVPIFLYSQNTSGPVTPDERLFEAYGQEYVQKVLVENPFLIKRWNYYLDHAFIIVDEVAEKIADSPVVEINDLENINILKLEKEQKLSRDWNKPTIYLIKDAGKMLIYHSGKDFTNALKKHLGQ